MENARQRSGYPGAQVEDESTTLLREHGVFRARCGIRSPRSERKLRARERRWEEWMAQGATPVGAQDLHAEMEELARATRLTAVEKDVLAFWRLEGCTLREIASRLRITLHHVRVYKQRALDKCARHAAEPPVSAAALFHEEVYRKRRAIYVAPPRGRTRTRDG